VRRRAPDGRGAPPEIPSYDDAVRGSSAALLRKRLEARGAPVNDAFVAKLAEGGEQDIRDRRQHGGKKMGMMMGGAGMPVFRYLTDEEVVAAYLYLEKYPPRP
jgi:hypothetical protein